MMERHTANDVLSSSASTVALGAKSQLSFLNRAARRARMRVLYVSRRKSRKASSQTAAIRAATQRTRLHPIVCAMAPAIAGPTAPPRSGASISVAIADPRHSGGSMSPMIAGLRTLEATAQPVCQFGCTHQHVSQPRDVSRYNQYTVSWSATFQLTISCLVTCQPSGT